MRLGPLFGEGKERPSSGQGCGTASDAGKRPSGFSLFGARLSRRRRNAVLVLAVVAIVIIASLLAVLSIGMSTPAATTPGTTHPIAPTPPSSITYQSTLTNVSGNYTVNNANGVTVHAGKDALAAIQAAIDSLSPGRSEKEAVLLQGDFVISGTINIPSYTILVLDGKIAWGGNESGFMLSASGQSNIEVQGGEWDGNRAARSISSDSNPMEFIRCSDVVIANLQVHDGPYDNIECEDCTNVLISNVESSFSNWNSILMAGCDNCVIENSHVHDSDQGGIYFYCEDDRKAQTINGNIIRNCLVERTQTSGLSFSIRGTEDRTDSGIIENNTVIDCGKDGEHPGINIGWGAGRLATNTAVRGNTIYSTGEAGEGGIEFAGQECVCEGNIIRDTPGYAIHLVGWGNQVTGNTIVRAGWSDGMAGVSIEGINNAVTGNTISDCPSYGIRVYNGLFNTVTPNEFSGNGRNIA